VTRRLRATLLLSLLSLVAAGCAIPTQGAPVSIAPSKVPFNLMEPHLPTTTTTQPKSYVAVKVFFLDATNQLQPAQRLVAGTAPLTSILDALMLGPTSGEVASGISSAIPSDVAVLAATTAAGNVVTVNMNSAFGEITGTDTELAVGQIVATVAAANGNGTGVLFEIDGQRTQVPVANGSEVSGPVYLIDFLIPPS
jgi:spore germination protein GerM